MIAGFFLFISMDIASYFHPEQIKIWLSNSGVFAPLIYIIMMALAVVVSPIPSIPLDIASGAFFGPLSGTIYSTIGGTIGAIISFLISRFLGRQFIERFLHGHINFCTLCSDHLLTKIIFFSRLLPVVSFDIISYGAGLTKLSLTRFTLATIFGMIPLTCIYNHFGAVIVFGKGISILLGLLMVILFFLIPHWIERYNLFSLRKFLHHLPKELNQDKI